jgi:ribosomal protein L11 methyltransferase
LNKYYYELIIEPDVYYELFLDLVSSLTQEAIEELNESIIIRSEEELDIIEAGVKEFTKELSTAFNTKIICKITYQKKENQDWIKLYQKSVQPILVGDFYIYPSWDKPINDKINIIIDPTLAFGSGHHETTSECLRAIEKYVKKDDEICDVGTGSGILGIAGFKLGAVVDICDTDIVAINDAINNFKQNSAKINQYWEGSTNETEKEYDVVIANIVADVIIMISKDIKKITKDNGIIILSGIMEEYKPKVLKQFKEYKVIEELQQNEWVTLIIKKEKNEQ